MGECQRVIINGVYAIMKTNSTDYILADVKTDKKTRQVYYPSVAAYSSELKLTADIINLCAKRGVFLKTINSIRELMSEGHRIAELCQQAINQLNKESEQ